MQVKTRSVLAKDLPLLDEAKELLRRKTGILNQARLRPLHRIVKCASL